MKSVAESIRSQIYERLNSPLFGSFVLAWACWNFRFLAILFSSSIPIDKRLEGIDKLFNTTFECWLHYAIGPAVSSVMFIYIYPIVSKHFYGYWLRRQQDLKGLRDKIEGATLLTVEESRLVRLEMIKQRDAYQDIINRQEKEIEALKSHASGKEKADESKISEEVVRKYQMESTTLRKENDDLRAKLNEKSNVNMVQKGTLELLKLVSDGGGKAWKDVILVHFEKSHGDKAVRATFYIDDAQKRDWILIRNTQRGDKYVEQIELTPKGREAAVLNGFV